MSVPRTNTEKLGCLKACAPQDATLRDSFSNSLERQRSSPHWSAGEFEEIRAHSKISQVAWAGLASDVQCLLKARSAFTTRIRRSTHG